MSLKSRETVSKRGMMRACERQGQQSAGLLRGRRGITVRRR
ncbi:MAG: hypothetical protein ACLTF3_26730 [Bacteroides ovatus]|nr:hypothetical protein [Phocaeicola dorei]